MKEFWNELGGLIVTLACAAIVGGTLYCTRSGHPLDATTTAFIMTVLAFGFGHHAHRQRRKLEQHVRDVTLGAAHDAILEHSRATRNALESVKEQIHQGINSQADEIRALHDYLADNTAATNEIRQKMVTKPERKSRP